jgi:hypothetical protein
MVNSIYNEVIQQLERFFGNQNPLGSGNGARFRYNSDYAITVYHTDIAAGNSVEIAFKPNCVNNIARITAVTGNQVKPNPRYGWLRVGIKSESEINMVVSVIQESFL